MAVAGTTALEQPTQRQRRRPRAAIAIPVALTVVALLLGLHDLGTPGLWLDEGATFTIASQHGAALWDAILHDGGNMSGYYLALHFWTGLFGTSPATLRFPSVLCYAATVPCSYALVRRLIDARAALFGAALVMVSESLVEVDQQARGYAAAALFLVAGALALVVALQESRRSAYVLWAVFGILAAYMTILAGAGVVAQLTAVPLLRTQHAEHRRLEIAGGAIAISWLPLAAMAIHRGVGQLAWIARPTAHGYEQIGDFFVSAPASSVVALLVAAACALGLWEFARCLARLGRSPEAFGFGFLAASALVPVAILLAVTELATPVLSERYVALFVPAASMLAGAGVARVRPVFASYGAVAALIALRALQLPSGYGVSTETWQPAVSYVLARYHPGDCLAFFVADGYTTFDYYLLRSQGPDPKLADPVLPATTWQAKTPYALDPATFTKTAFSEVRARCPRLWLVETHQTGEPPGPGVPAYQGYKWVQGVGFFALVQSGYKPIHGVAFTGVFVARYDRR